MIKLDARKFLQGSTTPGSKFLVTLMLMRDLFAIANLLVLILLQLTFVARQHNWA